MMQQVKLTQEQLIELLNGNNNHTRTLSNEVIDNQKNTQDIDYLKKLLQQPSKISFGGHHL